jgi:hypothetical protein
MGDWEIARQVNCAGLSVGGVDDIVLWPMPCS